MINLNFFKVTLYWRLIIHRTKFYFKKSKSQKIKSLIVRTLCTFGKKSYFSRILRSSVYKINISVEFLANFSLMGSSCCFHWVWMCKGNGYWYTIDKDFLFNFCMNFSLFKILALKCDWCTSKVNKLLDLSANRNL